MVPNVVPLARKQVLWKIEQYQFSRFLATLEDTYSQDTYNFMYRELLYIQLIYSIWNSIN